MPFHDSVYYPYPGVGGSGVDDAHQGTHSSAGIPSLLNSPTLHLHYPPPSSSSSSNHNNNNAAMTPSAIPLPASVPPPPPSTTPLPPFKFRARRESVDWRRVGALDVDRVAAELDVDALQRHVAAVAFCSLEGERCPACRAPLDPSLAKLFRLAQLTVEWLLHCQAALSGHLADAERAAAVAGDARQRLEARHARLEERARTLAGELRQRKRVIRAQQQGMLGPRCLGNHKCVHCDKSFINSTFLQNHLQRRHPDEFEMQSRSDSEEKKTKKKSQLDALQAEISELKEQLLQQQHTLLAKSVQEKEQESLQRDVVRELDRFRAEEMSRVERKIEESREGIRREMEILYARNLQARIEVEHSQTSRRETAEREQDAAAAVDAAAQTHAIQRLEQQLKKQDRKWESRMQDIKNQHESEKNQLLSELSRTQSLEGEQQSRGQRSREEMERRLQERERTISSQREQIKNLSSHPPATKVVEVPVVVTATAPEPKPKRLVREEAPLPQQLEPIQEMSEEDRDSSSVSEKRRPPAVSAVVAVSSVDSRRSEARERPSPATLRRNPGLLKDLRPALEHALADRLEDLGVRPGQSSLKTAELGTILSRVASARERAARETPQYWQHREEAARQLEHRLQQADQRRRDSEPAAGGTMRTKARNAAAAAAQASQNRPRSSSLPSRVTQVMSGPPAKQAKTPQPAPRTRTAEQPKTSTPIARTTGKASVPNSRTPPFSSDEDSEEEEETEEDDEEYDEGGRTRLRGPSQDPRGRSPQVVTGSKPHWVPVATQKQAGRPSPAMRQQQTPARSALLSMPNQQRAPATNTVKAAGVTVPDSDDDDWSDVSELQEIDPKRLQVYEDQNGGADKRPAAKQATVTELAAKVERQLAERGAQRPAGGVNVAPTTTKKKEEEPEQDVVQELLYTDLEESSDWAVSSLEEPGNFLSRAKPRPQGPVATRKSLDSSSTSVWRTSTGKGQKSGVMDAAGTGSTLKSSMMSLSDFSDSEEI